MQSHIIIDTQWKICFRMLAVVAIITLKDHVVDF